MRLRTIFGDILKVAIRWIAIPTWILAICAVITVFGHGCVSCVEYQNSNECYQRYTDGKFVIKRGGFLADTLSGGDSVKEAWKNASAECTLPEEYR